MTGKFTTSLNPGYESRRRIGEVLGSFNPASSFEAITRADAGSQTRLDIGGATLSPATRLVDESMFILDPPPQEPPVIGRFEIEQAFEGTVTAIEPDGETFTATLVDLSGDSPDEEAEFSLREMTDDKPLVVPGAIFSWTIGLQWRRRQCTRVSEIRFRRLPPFSTEAIAYAEARAGELASSLAAQDADAALPSRR